LILGAGGMLGNTLFRYFSSDKEYSIVATVRGKNSIMGEQGGKRVRVFQNIDVIDFDYLKELVKREMPDVIFNCVGIIKQLKESKDRLVSISINSLLPHQLNQICEAESIRLIHFSTDCVFSGEKGNYKEGDFADASDIYGRSKYLGEVVDSNCALTLRTSIIGHELGRSNSLVNWFLSQSGRVRGFTKAIFSGLPTVEVAKVVECLLKMGSPLSGLYHLSVDPISKYELLLLVRDIYGKSIEIEPDDSIRIDRSLNSDLLRSAIDYSPPSWRTLVERMYEFG